MNYKYIVNQYRQDRKNSSIRLLKWTRVIFHLVTLINHLDGIAIKLICILLGFQYDIYQKLYNLSYDVEYREHAEIVKTQIEITLITLGE